MVKTLGEIFRVTKAEKIEIVILGYLDGKRTTQGKYGRVQETGQGRYRVDTEDGEFIVCNTRIGWSVTQPGAIFTGEAGNLLEAGTLYFEERN